MKPSALERGRRLTATGRRKTREWRVRLVWKIGRAAGLVRRRANPTDYSSLAVVPPATTRAELADAVARANWYLSDSPLPIFLGGNSLAFDASDAPHLDPSLIHPVGKEVHEPGPRPFYLIRDLRLSSLWAARRDLGSVSVVDPDAFGYFEDWEYRRLRRWLHGGNAAASTSAEERLAALKGTTAVALGTGPSAGLLKGGADNWDVRVVCNSAVRNRELLEVLRPNVVMFSDAVFHFGPSRYARAFRDDLVAAVDLVDPVLVVPSDFLGLLLAALPQLRDRTVGLQTLDGGAFRIPSPRDLAVRSTGNVLTNSMLPIAAMLADQIDIAGCDGRKPGETYFWQHGKTVQYDDDLMRSAFDTHPSFFRDQDYGDYYDEHCRELATLVELVEAADKQVRSVTPSYIPALVARSTDS